MADEDKGDAGQQADPADTQQAADPNVDMVSRSEMNKVIEGRDKVKDRARTAEAKVTELQALVEEAEGNKITDEDREILAKAKADAEESARSKALKAGDADAIAQRAAEQAAAPLEQENEQLRSKLERRESQLTRTSRDEALLKAATDADAVNPNQIVGLLRSRVTMTEDPVTGAFEPSFVGEDGQPVYAVDGSAVTIDSFVRTYLSAKGNENLVKSAATPGSGARSAGGAPSDTQIPTSLEEYKSWPKDRQDKAFAAMTPEQRKALIPGAVTTPQPGSLISK